MARKTYVYRPGHPLSSEFGFVDKEELYGYSFDDMRGSFGNEPLSVHVISDTMEPTRHMGDGKTYTSKHKFREATRRAGCIEVGDQTHHLTKPKQPVKVDRRQLREDIKRSIHELRNGRDIRQEVANILRNS